MRRRRWDQDEDYDPEDDKPGEPKKLVLRPLIGLAEVKEESLPRLHVSAYNKKKELLCSVEAVLTALVVTPHNHDILYLEAVCTSSATAHAIMGCATENPGSQEWSYRLKGQRMYESGIRIHEPDSPRIADLKLPLKGHSGLHHFSIMSRDESFLIANDEETLWRKLRKKMSCPTMENWGKPIMEKVRKAEFLLPCESFGMPKGMSVYCLDLDAEKKFDEIVGEFVRERGGLN